MKKQNVTFSHHNQASTCIASREETSLHLAQQLNTHANLYFFLTAHLHHIHKNYFHVLMVFNHLQITYQSNHEIFQFKIIIKKIFYVLHIFF